MTESWSTRIADRYQCRLSAELADWFDSEVWKEQGEGEFRQSIAPQSLLDQAPEEIWPGMMGCDCLPILSNMAGDWLAVRIDCDNVASQIVHWYHGGGDWIPWGDQLAQAIAFDLIADRFPSQARRHAIPAESPRLNSPEESQSNDPFVRWAFGHLPAAVTQVIESSNSGSELAGVFLENKVAEVAIRCELTISSLLGPSPNWDSAATIALPVTKLAPELAWAWETIGFAAERRGDLSAAKDAFLSGANCSSFTDQSIRLGTYVAATGSAKFSVARLRHLDPELLQSSPYMRMLCNDDQRACRMAVSRYWLQDGLQHQRHGDELAAHESFVAAGWDIGATPIKTYGIILERIAEAAVASDQTARAEVAQTHRRRLQVRFAV